MEAVLFAHRTQLGSGQQPQLGGDCSSLPRQPYFLHRFRIVGLFSHFKGHANSEKVEGVPLAATTPRFLERWRENAVTGRPKRCFSQNFLRDPVTVDRIVAAAGLTAGARVFEIGPGMGALTWRLLPFCDELHVAEIDVDLAADLTARCEPRLIVHVGDALELDWPVFLAHPPYTLVANLPYHISSPIFFKILESRFLFRKLVLMFQKEFGARLCAAPGTKDYGILSVFCRQYFNAEVVTEVPPQAFHPVPKVASVVLSLIPLSSPRLDVDDERFFFRVVRGAFSQRRKTLPNSLKSAGFPSDGLAEKILFAGIDPKRRGETLELEEFAALASVLRRRCED